MQADIIEVRLNKLRKSAFGIPFSGIEDAILGIVEELANIHDRITELANRNDLSEPN